MGFDVDSLVDQADFPHIAGDHADLTVKALCAAPEHHSAEVNWQWPEQ